MANTSFNKGSIPILASFRQSHGQGLLRCFEEIVHKYSGTFQTGPCGWARSSGAGRQEPDQSCLVWQTVGFSLRQQKKRPQRSQRKNRKGKKIVERDPKGFLIPSTSQFGLVWFTVGLFWTGKLCVGFGSKTIKLMRTAGPCRGSIEKGHGIYKKLLHMQ